MHDLVGKQYGRLSVLYDSGQRTRAKVVIWVCKCSCGKEHHTAGSNLTQGRTKSCGCLRRDKHFVHGCASRNSKRPAAYYAFFRAQDRCQNPKNQNWEDYGGRGIKFLFASVRDLIEAVGPRPSASHTLDRINNDGNYEPSNVRWATWEEQANNRRKRRWQKRPR